MPTIRDLVSPSIFAPKKPASKPDAPELSMLAFASTMAFVPVTMEPNPPGPNNVIQAKDGPNPAGPSALSSLKDVLACGEYKHPIHGWSLNVTPKALDKYCAAFSEMTNAGVRVPIYQDHRPGAANTLGYCRALFRGGPDAIKQYPELAKLPADQAPMDSNRLYAIHDWNSPESMKLGHGVGQVSVLIDKKMQDGTGKKYGEAVRHIAVTPEPIVPGQGSFTQLAASLLTESKTGLYAMSKDDDDGDEDDYEGLKAATVKATEKAAKSGSVKDRMAAAMAHHEAAEHAPSDEEKKAHLDCAAKHLHEAAYAVGNEMSPEKKAAKDIKDGERKIEQKHGTGAAYMSLISPVALELSRTTPR